MVALAHDQHVDWPRVIADLTAAGHTSRTIAKQIGLGERRESTVRAWLVIECEPRHDHGERLIGLWCRVMRVQRERVPIVSRYAAR